MASKWESQAYRNVYKRLVRQMNSASMRDRCYSRYFLTQQQVDSLSALDDANHNRKLLSLLARLNDDDYEVFCQELLDDDENLHRDSVAEMRKASCAAAAASASADGPAATSSATSPLEGDPFDTDEYIDTRVKLMEQMDMSAVRTRVEAVGLIKRYQFDTLLSKNRPQDKMDHNRELFEMMEAGGVKSIRRFSAKVLPHLGQCERHKESLDRLLAKYK